ncbi:MAG TPA: YCF48-related protein, partial [Saprospiraceae bacterium]|nr:YCF48-related protein [Saprospiraceae bacterium]
MKLKLSSLVLLLLMPFLIKAQWQRQYPLPKLSPVQAISVHHDGFGYAAGSDDLLMKLDPGTKTWSIVGDWAKNWRFTAVDYLEGDGGQFAAAGGPGFIMTENGGLNWTEIAGAPQGITAIKIFSSTDMIIIATSGVFRWKDKTWSNLNLPATSNVQGGDLLDDQHIWAFTNGASAAMYATADGGQHWTTSHDISSPDVVKFYNTDYGIATDSRMIFKSVNGGVNWTLISNNVIANTSADITFGASPNVLMSAALNANPAISQDSGKTWTNKPTGFISTRSFSVGATSDEDFWLGNDISSIAHTSDAGETWVESSGPPRNIIQDVHFINRTDGWAVGLKGYVLRTHDGGTVWEDISKPDTKNYLCIDGLNENDLWIGSNQRILHSTDKGDNWTEKVVFLSGNINDILALSSTRILACSSTGVIYRTKDGGVKWDTVFSTSGQIRSLTRINNQQCMATGFNGVIMRSEDMGDTWHAVAIPLAGLQYEQSYFLGNEGWLVTSSFKHNMWHTTNGGDSWDTLTLPIDRFWDGIYFITPDTGIAVCHSNSEGRAYITFDGGAAWQTGYILPYQLSGVTGVHNPNGTAWIFGFGSDIEFLPYCNTLPGISDFMGDLFPCEKDTVSYSVSSLNVDQFFWNIPHGWQFIGDPDNDTIQVEVGRNSGFITV